MPTVDLTPRLARESKPGDKDTILFDRTLPGFGLRIHPSGRKVWIVQARIEGRSRRLRIARHGEMEQVADENPADDIRREKESPTLGQFADEYLRRSEPHWKPSGRKTLRNYVKARILPTFGRMALDRIGAQDAAAWFDAASRDRPGAANRAFEILRAMMFRAEKWGLRERDNNPCLGIAKNPRNNVAPFLDTDELARLALTLDAREAQWPEAVAAIRLLVLSATATCSSNVSQRVSINVSNASDRAEQPCASRPHLLHAVVASRGATRRGERLDNPEFPASDRWMRPCSVHEREKYGFRSFQTVRPD